MSDVQSITGAAAAAGTDSETYGVAGMTCGGCVNSVTQAVSLALPDSRVEVSLQQGSLTVFGPHDEAAVRAAVDGAGFDFTGPREVG